MAAKLSRHEIIDAYNECQEMFLRDVWNKMTEDEQDEMEDPWTDLWKFQPDKSILIAFARQLQCLTPSRQKELTQNWSKEIRCKFIV